MKCLNCGLDAGRKGNRHVKSRKFTCKRTSREMRTKRNWLGRREDYWVDVEVPSLSAHSLTDWRSSDEYSVGSYDSYYDRSTDYSRYADHDKSSSVSHSHRSDDYTAPSRSSYSDDSSSSSGSYSSGPSWGSSGGSSSDSGSSYGSSDYSSGSSSSDSG